MESPLRIVCLVEGQGEVRALPELLRRVLPVVGPGVAFQIAEPYRMVRSRIEEVRKDIEAAILLAGPNGVVLMLRDSDDELPCVSGPKLAGDLQITGSHRQIAFTLAYREYESWFIAAAESLAGKRGLNTDLACPKNFESIRDAKGWLSNRMADPSGYSPINDQVALTAVFDMELARQRSKSFARFYRLCEKMLKHAAKQPPDQSPPNPA